MRLPRVYVNTPLQSGTRVGLDRDTSHYLTNVLRFKNGDALRLFNDNDGEFEAAVEHGSRKQVQALVGDQVAVATPAAVAIHLGLGLSRGDRMDYAIQKSTELGVSAITPIYSDYGEVRFRQQPRLENKLRHWRRIMISACEQSGRITLPAINPPVTFSDWLTQRKESLNLILDPEASEPLDGTVRPDSISVLIGPEGGFSAQELAEAEAGGLVGLKLGPRVLRTETAPVAALAILQYQFGDI